MLVGAWRLVTYEDRDSEDDPWTTPFGERPLGIGVYDHTGLVSMQVFADPTSPSAETFVAYIGKFVIRHAASNTAGYGGIVEHRIDAASTFDLLVEDPARPFVVVANTLTLGDGRTWRRVFTRLE
jgi:hypothetical protein